jgi:hypothetical protein
LEELPGNDPREQRQQYEIEAPQEELGFRSDIYRSGGRRISRDPRSQGGRQQPDGQKSAQPRPVSYLKQEREQPRAQTAYVGDETPASSNYVRRGDWHND